MSDSDMDIDDDEVQVHAQHTIAGESGLLATPIKASDTQNDMKKHSDEQSKIINDSIGNSQPNISGNSGKNIMLEDEKGTVLSRFPAHVDVKKHSDEQTMIINSQPNISRNIVKNIMLEDEKGKVLSRFPAPAQSFPLGNGPGKKRASLPYKFFAKETLESFFM